MTDLSTPACPRVVVRKAARADLRQLVLIEVRVSAPGWAWQDLPTALRAEGGRAVVAEADGRVVGFLLYRTAPPPGGRWWGAIRRLLGRCRRGGAETGRRIDLLRIAVLPGWQRQGVGLALLRTLHRQCRRPSDWVRAIVPETQLAGQLFLRGAGYKAVRILSGYHGTEDGYVMERPG